ncbi:MAG: hypothetical protein Kow0092_34050 [Deferrisomatales bacterium]
MFLQATGFQNPWGAAVSSIKTKLCLLLLVLVTGPLAVTGTLLYGTCRAQSLAQVRLELDGLARSVRDLCRTYGPSPVPDPGLLRALGRLRDGRTGLVLAAGPEGTVRLGPEGEDEPVPEPLSPGGETLEERLLAVRDGWVRARWREGGDPERREVLFRVVPLEPSGRVVALGAYPEAYLRPARSALGWAAGAGAACVLLSLALGYLWAHRIATPLGALADGFERLARGDLTVSTELVRSDELGRLAQAFREMRGRLAELLATITESAGSVGAEAQQVTASTRQVAEGAGEQSMKATEVAAAVEEVSATVLDVSRSAQEMAGSARQMSEAAQRGERVLADSLQRMEAIARRVEEVAEDIADLGRRTESIGTVIGTIQDIADQTQLLALNAAIEAARAGEHGRGFAVVADEVRKLAEKTTKATTAVTETVQAIQGETARAVEAAGAGKDEALGAREVFGTTREAFQAILEQVAQVSRMVHQIAVATEEQSAAVGEISTYVDGMAPVSRTVAGEMDELAGASDTLAQEARALQDAVRRFRIDPPAPLAS